MRGLFIVVRILGAAAIVAAIVGQLVVTYRYWGDRDLPQQFAVINFFSYFTIDSNVLSVVVLLIGAVILLRGRQDSPRFAVLRASVVSYMVVTGIVYNTLLRGVNVSEGLVVEWSNEILHVVGPLLLAIDWLLAPGRITLGWSKVGTIVIFPIVWVAYTMIRGPLAYEYLSDKPTWYPYPFLNPANSPEGYVSVAFYVVLIAAIIGGVGAAVIWVSRRGRWPLKTAG